jgi:tetratricopeptide (TPR) repeat protein
MWRTEQATWSSWEGGMGQHPRELTPYASPAHYWGAELRALRQERNLSLARLGKLVACDPSHLARIERGERPIPPGLPGACDRGLDAGEALTRLYALVLQPGQHVIEPPDGHRPASGHVANPAADVARSPSPGAITPPRQAPWDMDAEATILVRDPDGRIMPVNVPRRLFLQGAGAAAVGAATGAMSWPLTHPAAGRSPAEHFLLVRKTLADNDNLFGPRQVIPLATSHVAALQQLRTASRGADQQQLLQIQTQFADLLGWLYQDSGDFRAAQYWMDRALEWSHLATDLDSTVFVLARKSQLAGDMGNSREAIDVAEAAIKLARPHSRLGAVAATYAAHGYALDADRAGCDRHYDDARSLLGQADRDNSPWGQFFDIPYITVQRARSLAVLGDHRAAADGFRSAIDNLQHGYHRDHGVYLAREARAYAEAGEADHSADLGLQALTIGTQTSSARIFTELARLEDILTQQTPTGHASQFCTAMNEIVVRQA